MSPTRLIDFRESLRARLADRFDEEQHRQIVDAVRAVLREILTSAIEHEDQGRKIKPSPNSRVHLVKELVNFDEQLLYTFYEGVAFEIEMRDDEPFFEILDVAFCEIDVSEGKSKNISDVFGRVGYSHRFDHADISPNNDK
ncbi:MAG: hypothetical protein AAFO06_19185 [Cyanobacteria bacterium J06597_16]